jgi:uncharacterized repeat protein (TIGR01451 family)
MLIAPRTRHAIVAFVCTLLLVQSAVALARGFDGPTTAGTQITNRAEATYVDDSGTSFTTVSPTVTMTILAVTTLTVTPDETTPSATVGPRERVVRLFRTCNAGNTTDAYSIKSASVNAPATLTDLYFDTDGSATLTSGDELIRPGETLSPQVAPGACVSVLAVVETNDSAPHTTLAIHLTALSNTTNAANGRAEDSGTIINDVGAGARLTSPDDASLPPVKMVNGSAQAVVAPGNPFTYTITFRNNGDTPARGVILSDDLPATLEYVADSLQLENRNLSDAQDTDEGYVANNRVLIHLATEVAPAEVVHVSFKARLKGSAPAGVGLVNVANFTGLNFPATQSSAAVVLIDPFGIVFAGRGGSASPIPGATVEVLLDQNGTNKLPSVPDVGFTPNAHNDNPFMTDGLGHFSFALTPDQLGTATNPARYFMRLTAQGYSTRMLEVTVRPTQAGLYALLVHAIDGQPLASAGGFDLVREDVTIADLAAIAFNIPMFEQHGMEITKSVDRPRAEMGDVLTYRVEIHNPSAAPVNDVVIQDQLPASFNYVTGTARLALGSATEQPVEPETAGSGLIFRLGTIGPGASARLMYRVRIGANAREGQQDNVAVGVGLFPSGERTQTAPARASVMVGRGVFSTRQVILGRVFVDTNGNGKFDDDDKPMPGVRLYLSSGQSVKTDSQGLYNFPSLGDGPQVLSLDPVSLPQRYALADDGTLSNRSWTRLLRTPLGGGALLRQNYMLVARDDAQDNSAEDHTSNSSAPRGVKTNSLPTLPTHSDAQKAATNPAQQSAKGDAAQQTATQQQPAVVSSAETPQASGTYEFISTETLAPVPPGEVKIISPAPKMVIMTPAMQLEARVALNWTVKLEVNDHLISDKTIGTSRLDQKNSLATYTFVGIELRPGPNTVRVTAISPEGSAGHTEEMMVLGRGPVRRLEIVSEKTEIQADGNDSTILHIRAFDQWNSPALDDQVAVETSVGQLLRLDDRGGEIKLEEEGGELKSSDGKSSSLDGGSLSSIPVTATLPSNQSGQTGSQVIVPLAGGEALVKFVASGAPGEARLHTQMGQHEAEARIRITPEMRPTILVGLAEVTVGQAVPEVSMRGEQGNVRSRLSFFYSGRVWAKNALTVAYDSQRPINRTAGRDRLFQMDPLDRVYPLFGDSSTRYEAAQSNSKLYARLDHNRSYAMFGDFTTDMEDLTLAGYDRRLTGVKLHVENSMGDFVTVTGARPDTSFARDVFPAGGLGILRLSHAELLPGSEQVMLEVRDRRNPEIIISRETLARSVDYNLNPATGELFFLRYVSSFDYNLNLVQLVVTYEHRANSLGSAVYTARARKNFAGMGLRLGFGAVMQKQEDEGSFVLGGLDGEKNLPNKGKLRFAYARSQGRIMGSGNFFEFGGSDQHDGDAYQVELDQPLPFSEATLQARYSNASAGFFNPFGATVTPGSRRGEVAVELKPRSSSTLRFGVADERNRTANVDNTRLTLSAVWEQVVNERLHFRLGYDHRSFDDARSGRSTQSDLISAAAEVKVTDKLNLSVKREQNLSEADPTYPDQTTLAATYQATQWTKLFLTQRLASAPIMPIADFSGSAGAGLSSTNSRRETAFGVETRFGKYTSMVGRYQLENGINGTDSFAVVGLQNRLPLSKQLSLELGFERGFHMAGRGQSFDSATVGFGWQPNQDFRASARYEFRDRGGMGQLVSIGAAGRISEGVTALARVQLARTGFEGRSGSNMDATAALAVRPLSTDRMGLLFSYNHRSLSQEGVVEGGPTIAEPTRARIDSLSTDGYFQATKNVELYGRFALRFSGDGQKDLPFVQTLTYLGQARVQYHFSRRFDLAGETRMIFQPSSGSQRSSYGTELGFWVLPDLRVGVGYNFTRAGEPGGVVIIPTRRGFYFTISSKLSNLFDLFGTSQNGLAGAGKDVPEKDQPKSGEAQH